MGATSLYVVPVYEFAIVTQFGRVVEEVKEPGLKFKIPFIQEVTMIDRRLRNWDGEPSDLLTVDKENIEVNTWARWKVTEPRRFYEAVRTESAGRRPRWCSRGVHQECDLSEHLVRSAP